MKKDRSAGKKIAIALVVGLGAVLVATVVAPKVPQLQATPWLVPGLFVGGGLLLAMRGRTVPGIALAGGGGASFGIVYGPTILSKLNMSPQGQQGQTAGPGWTQAGAMNSGWYERPALPAAGMQGSALPMMNNAGQGWQEAGAFGGRDARVALETQGYDGDDDDDF